MLCRPAYQEQYNCISAEIISCCGGDPISIDDTFTAELIMTGGAYGFGEDPIVIVEDGKCVGSISRKDCCIQVQNVVSMPKVIDIDAGDCCMCEEDCC